MSLIHGGQLVVKSLKREGIKYLFTLSGHSVDYIYDACIDEGIRIIDTRHEQAAAHMADGWTRVTHQPAVLAVTDSPGVAAMVPGLFSAAFSPVLVLAGKSDVAQQDLEGRHEADQLAIVQSLVKWGRTVFQTERIPEYISMAFRHAMGGSPGPAYLEIPRDVIEKKVDQSSVPFPEQYRTEVRPQGDPGEVSKAVDLLLSAKRPLIAAGNGAWWSQAGEETRQLAETLNIPFLLKGKARGIVPEDHPLFIGSGMVGTREADVVLAVGIRFNGRFGFGRPPSFSQDCRVIQVDCDATAIGQNRPVDIGLVGDPKAILGQMVLDCRDKCGVRPDLPWIQHCSILYRQYRQKLEDGANSDAIPIHPARLWKEVFDCISREAIVATDGGNAAWWARSFFKASYPGHLLDTEPRGLLGSAIPFAIAAKLARPDKQVLVCNGDGSFGINGMEFDTAARHGIPIVAVVANNGCWATCTNRQVRLFGQERVVGTRLGFTRYEKMVADLGGYGEWVENPGDIKPALKRALASGVPACINVKIDPTFAVVKE
ncbi:MAG: thiamine pyrophosphate-binding protein [Chloroflexi bacterium]|nr:thiamine pyrophosphate-binding protein [Chloroflexota bacterium]